MYCGQCGTRLAKDDRFCPGCGAPVTDVEASDASDSSLAAASSAIGLATEAPAVADGGGTVPDHSPTVTVPTAGIPDSWRTGILVGQHPLELWIVIALFAIPGAYLTITGIDALTSGLDLLSFSTRFALLIALIALLVISIGVAFLGIAWMLFVGSRVGRGLAYVVASMALLAVILSEDSGGGSAYRSEGLIALGSVAAIVLLGLAPAVREGFSGPDAPAAGEPTSVVIARVCIAAAVWANGVLGLALLLLGDVNSSYYAYGLLELGASGLLLHVYRRLCTPDRRARVLASIAAAIGILATLLGPGIDGVALGVAVPATVLVCLWIAPDARRWFGDEPIAISREPQS